VFFDAFACCFLRRSASSTSNRGAPDLAQTGAAMDDTLAWSHEDKMQFRQLRYFVKIVEAGSLSRAASIVHVAQPALSEQIAELEQRLGVLLLQRNARGVRPTAAGEILYKEASAILHQLDQLPSVVRSSSGEPEGVVALGIMASLAPKLVAGILEECRTALPKVTIRVTDGDSLGLEHRIASSTLDIGILYEDEFQTPLMRKQLFTQKLFLASGAPLPDQYNTISLERIAGMPLVLPGPTHGRRRELIERTFADAGLKPRVALEADSLASEMWAVRNNVGCAIVPIGDMSHFGPGAFAKPILIEPAIHMTCSMVYSSDLPLTNAGEAVRDFLPGFIKRRVHQPDMPGVEWIAKG
jgi:LysR family nitrogen assimilation transcriptional regulator